MNRMEQFSQSEEPKDVLFLGGKDLEMDRIEKRARRRGVEVVSKDLSWEAAAIDVYHDEIEEVLAQGNIPVAIELRGADAVEGVVDIDHHNEKSHRPASILQILERLGKEATLVDKLVAANDSGYIPAMAAVIEEQRSLLESRYGAEKFEKFKTKLIDLVRRKDRETQGVTPEMEAEAEQALLNAEHRANGLVIVRLNGDRPAPVTDRLYSSWSDGKQNLIVVCNSDKAEKEVWFFGPGDICKEARTYFLEVKKTHAWGGGKGYGQQGENAFCGIVATNPEEPIEFISAMEDGQRVTQDS